MLSAAFLDPEYNSTNNPNYIREANVCPIKNQLYLPNTLNYVREQMFAQLRTGLTWTKTFKKEIKKSDVDQHFSEPSHWN